MNRPASGKTLPKVLYNLALFSAAVCSLPWLVPRAIHVPKLRKTFMRRLHADRIDPGKLPMKARPVWVHALSVGEVLSAIPLVKALKNRHPEKPLIFSASTATGFEAALRALNHGADALVHFPYDLLFSVQRAFNTIQPDCIVLVETDIWPNFLWEARRRNIPVFLSNARLSDRTFTRFYRVKSLACPLLSIFSGIFAQSAVDARRFGALGIPKATIHVTGNIKFDQPLTGAPPPPEIIEWAKFHRASGRGIWVAGSTHEAEEPILAQALSMLAEKGVKAALVVAPRDPDRSRKVEKIFKNEGFSAERLSTRFKTHAPAQAATPVPRVLIVDAIGLLRGIYRLSDVAFVGGSLVAFGGHNPLEPAACAKPVLFGPHMQSFRDISAALLRSKAALTTATAVEIAGAITRLLVTDREKARTMGLRAFRYYSANQGAVHRTLDQMDLKLKASITIAPESASHEPDSHHSIQQHR